MNNKIHYVSLEAMLDIKNHIEQDNSLFIAEINGVDIPQIQDYLALMSTLFQFPIPSRGLDGYNDWMRDLEWINKDGYVLVINNYKDFLHQDIQSKKAVINGFTNTILPFWEEEVKHVVVGGEMKRFTVYLVD